MSETLTRLLEPRERFSLLESVTRVNSEQARPFSIVFVGVNGVGKSTNLAKVCRYLKATGLSVLIAACDTFRSGAVEQLKVHAGKLDVEVFERGYGKDAAAIAAEAIAAARQQQHNVVLIDTAGRMQDNDGLMRALGKLVNRNEPDLIVFVGEALVGNQAFHQLSGFNRALADASTRSPPRQVDGIILSKFDTIDDKVGAAITLVKTSGAPILFLGVGQQHTDLRELNTRAVVNALLR